MKQILVLLAATFTLGAQAVQPMSEVALPETQEVIFNCVATEFSEDVPQGYIVPPQMQSFEVVRFGWLHSTIIGKSFTGAEYLLSESLPQELRDEEPMRGFYQLKEILGGAAYHLDLYNDSDQPETEMLLTQTHEEQFEGKIVINWDFKQSYKVKCTKN